MIAPLTRKVGTRLSLRNLKIPLIICILVFVFYEITYYSDTNPIDSVHQFVYNTDSSKNQNGMINTYADDNEEYDDDYDDDKNENQPSVTGIQPNPDHTDEVPAPASNKQDQQTESPKQTPVEFWSSIFKTFSTYKFEEGDLPLIKLTRTEEQYKPKDKTRKTFLSKAIIRDVDMLKAHHRNIFRLMPDQLPTSVYEPESKGIVTIGGGFYSWMAYVQLLQLRKIGSELPVEIIIPNRQDYKRERQFCEKFLPQYNAKCVVVEDRFGADVVKNWNIVSYQYKAVALAISSFQHTLLLDSDNSPVQAPDRLFESKVYKKNGMVLWPDYWKRTMSPEWYEIIDKPVSLTEKVRDGRFPLVIPQKLTPEEEEETSFTDLKGTIADLSTESGQVMLNKATHGKVALMTLYYNIFGPVLYYKLFSLGALGEGDKDTFATAAHVCDKDYYQVKSYIHTYGYFDDGYHGMTMAQKDPEEDYQEFLKVEKEYREKGINWDKQAKDHFSGDNKIPVFTLHCNIRKINPAQYMEDSKISDLNENRLRFRFYSNFKIKVPIPGEDEVQRLDFERTRWETVEEIACVQKVKFSIFKDKDMKKVCQYIRNTIEWLTETEKP